MDQQNYNSNYYPDSYTSDRPQRFNSAPMRHVRNEAQTSRTPFYKQRRQRKQRNGPNTQSTPRIDSSLMLRPRISFFPLFCSNLGLDLFCSVLFQSLRGRDYRMADFLSVHQLTYVATIAYCNRIVQIATKLGYHSGITAASQLKDAAQGIWLPNVLTRLINSLGSVVLTSGAVAVPWADNYEVLFPQDSLVMLSPETILNRAERPIPNNHWRIDHDWIQSWNANTTRASRQSMKFELVSLETEGNNEMLCSYEAVQRDPQMQFAYAPQTMTEAECELGGAYYYRNYAARDQWLGPRDVPGLLYNSHQTRAYSRQSLLSELIVKSFVERND